MYLTIYYRDSNDAMSETSVDVNISEGPNLRPPRFEQSVYDAQVQCIFQAYKVIAIPAVFEKMA